MASPLNPGDVVAERFRIERVLGEGGMGVVLAAEHLGLNERVALKVLLPEAARIPGVVERFQREARAAMRIQSEHVARVMDVGLLGDGTSYLVMEYLEGRDLSQELEASGRLPIETAVGYVLEGMIGVAEAHALGIVHRDLKPSNLFLTRPARGRSLVKVLDFGIAKEVEDTGGKKLTSTFSALGSAAYMSPEQVRMAKSVDVRSDVWSLGIVLYELLTAEMPFEGGSLPALSAAIIADPPRPISALRPDIPPALAKAIHACLEKERERRTPSLAVLAQALAPFGGAYASVHVARIVQALGESESAPSAIGSTAVSAKARLEQRSGPSWSNTQAGTADAGRSRGKRIATLGAA
ncbi:MAG: serine/threonine-protein kinase, partial [Steroidobacteraceae bacterium]